MINIFTASLLLLAFALAGLFFIIWNDRKERRAKQTKQ
jgi:hypothetical protein